MYKIKLKNKAFSTILRNACGMVCGATFFLATGCKDAEPALTDEQKLALDFYAYENELTNDCPLEGDKAIEFIKRKTGNDKTFNDLLEANKTNLRILTVIRFKKGNFKDKTCCYVINCGLVKLESSKPANTGIRDEDQVVEQTAGKYGFLKFDESATTKFNKLKIV